MSALSYQDIVKDYGNFHLGPVTLSIPEGYVTGLVGVNGAGKTTLIKLALGLIHPTSGTVNTCNHEKIGVIYDTPSMSGHWKVIDFAKVMQRFYASWNQSEFDRLLEWGGIDKRKKVNQLSRGMGMKLQFATALAHDAKFLILDEPTSGLDPLARHELLDMIADFMMDETNSVLFSTHITSDLARVADHLVLLHQGQLISSGSTSDILDEYRLVRGASEDLCTVQDQVVGLRQHSAGWEGLIRTEDTVALSGRNAQVQEPTVDELLIHLTQGATHV
ncbi:ABC transporter ATP-binding protein [Austwickia chelonae]|uniref:ABC transporter ATP-binding protein n=1 Tax=Austwickia chelonae TaxID=100225 RepID=UPI000E25BB50|nr:ABC transporter ATP-binding protein [Austwickia chelonae]